MVVKSIKETKDVEKQKHSINHSTDVLNKTRTKASPMAVKRLREIKWKHHEGCKETSVTTDGNFKCVTIDREHQEMER